MDRIILLGLILLASANAGSAVYFAMKKGSVAVIVGNAFVTVFVGLITVVVAIGK